MKKRINLRLIGIALLAILVTLFGVTSIYYRQFENQVKKDLHILADVLVDSDIFYKENMENISFYDKDIRITWIDGDGHVLYDNKAAAEELENHLSRPEVELALKEGTGESVRTSGTLRTNTYYYAIKMADGTVLRVAVDANTAMDIFISALPITIVIVAVLIIICVILANYLTKRIIRPIQRLSDNLSNPLKITEDDGQYKELVPFMNTIRKQHENILAAAKMRQDFTAAVSHELKTPLTAISGYAELIENRMVTPEQEVKFAGEIRKNSHRLLILINDIIRLSELDNPHEGMGMEPLDLYALAVEAAQNLSMNAQKRGIHFTLSGRECIIRGNREMLRELIENLCENAIRYNNEGGNVSLFVGMIQDKPTLVVEDNGIGIPKEHQERVFERFYRVDKSRSRETGGTGLGLAIVKHIVAIHDASIRLESEEGKGTKITVEF